MHAVKCAWAGQAFAVAGCNDSGGRKTRIRRSKEERKSMVETFIKTYQKSNNGNFPSLNLTHKEVGGSFYTVREIVREIIQENRILGPSKFPSEELTDEHPFFSLSVEPHSSLSSIDAIPVTTDVAPSHYQSTSEENVLDSNGHIHGFDKNQSDNEQMVGVRSDILEQDRHEEPNIPSRNEILEDERILHYNLKFSETDVEKLNDEKTVECSDAIEKDDNMSNDTSRNLLLHHQGDVEDNKISFSSGNVTETEAQSESMCSEEIVDGSSHTVERVETPQEPIYIESPVKESLADNEDGAEELKVSKAGVTRKIADVVVEKFPLRPISTTFFDSDENISEINDTSLGARREHDIINSSKNPSHLMNKKVDAMLAGPTLEMSSEVMNKKVLESSLQSSTSSLNEAATAADLKVKDSSVETKTFSGSSNRSYEKLVSEESLAIKNRPGTQEHDSSHQKGNNPPLDRINLETWKETTGTTNKHETNPLLAFFKALITPIMKLLD
nr:GPI-anchored adhesin-like protein precursor [Ipomoea batatas]